MVSLFPRGASEKTAQERRGEREKILSWKKPVDWTETQAGKSQAELEH